MSISDGTVIAQPNVGQANMAKATATLTCTAHTWCAEVGNHTTHASAYIEAPTLDGYGDCILPANLMAEDGAAAYAPTVGFLDLNLTAEQTRARVTELHRHLDQVAALADLLDGQAPLELAAECYSVTAPGADGALISAEIFRSDDPQPGGPAACLAVFGLMGGDADLDVEGADQLIADLEDFLPRLRALRNHLAATVAGPQVRP
ncbi:hypothetical protein [Streptomyces sp. NPDC001876]|uniref:DUF6907 domain-containing protein n=1 Tax=Streptomyces sp. NPDC001876 TaxID=3154402 RepID=UPI003323E8F2